MFESEQVVRQDGLRSERLLQLSVSLALAVDSQTEDAAASWLCAKEDEKASRGI